MQTKDVILKLRTKKGWSQEELAEKLFVTRQAVSKWETGEAVPNTETLRLLSDLFGVSINTLLGSPRQLFCQCCGMPLADEIIGKNKDGSFNEEYCKWCYADGEYTYDDMDELIEVCVRHMKSAEFSENQAREYMKTRLPELKYWKNFQKGSGKAIEDLKKELIEEFNALAIDGMPKVKNLNALVGGYVNLAYILPSGEKAKFLNDGATYFGNQLPSEKKEGKCFGILGNDRFLLVSTYEEGGTNPELILYKKR